MTSATRVPTEAEVQRRVVATYKAVGCVVASLSQYRPSKVAPGLPDLYVFPPLRRDPTTEAIVRRAPYWHETKRPGGKQSPEQKVWQRACEARGISYVLGGMDEALAHLRLIGLVA